jgi:hypothetical protein
MQVQRSRSSMARAQGTIGTALGRTETEAQLLSGVAEKAVAAGAAPKPIDKTSLPVSLAALLKM